MKKIILSALSVIVIGSIVFISCKPKNDSDAITPTYKDEASSGTGNNPNITNVTTTGTIATTSTQQNSSIPDVGSGAAWTSSGCQAGQTCLVNINSSTNTTITVCFLAPPTAGTYQLVNSSTQLTSTKAFMTVSNPPGQDAGSNWYSSAGNITISLSTVVPPALPSITGVFSNIACYKTPGSFYSVTVSGQVGCL